MRLITDKERGRKLRARRMALGLSQKELAKLLRCAQSHVSYLERGIRSPSRNEMKALAVHLRVPIESLVFRGSATSSAA